MFCVLQIEEPKSDLKSKIYEYTHKPEIQIEKIESAKMLPFFKITATRHMGKIPWKEIEEASGKLRSRMLAPDEIAFPSDTKLKKYKSVVFPKRVLFKSAVTVLKKLRLDPTKMSVTVFDENGFLIDLIEELVMLSCMIRVVTFCIQPYEELKEKLFSKHGISILVSSKYEDSILTSTAIISDNSAQIPLIYGGLLFTNERRQMLNATVLCGKKITLPPKFESLRDKNIDRMTFAGALYELCGVKELDGTVYDDMS